MVKNSTFRVPEMEQGDSNFDWNNVRLFVQVAQCSSLRRASQNTGLSVNSLRRRLDHLEQHMGCTLLVRDPHGSHLTEDGKRLLSASRRMFEASFEVAGAFSTRQQDQSGKVAIGATEGLGAFWLVPQLSIFQQTHPNIVVELQFAMEPPDVFSMQADLSVQMKVPVHKELMVTRLGYMHLQMFVSQDIIRRHGVPTSTEDLRRFGFVEYKAPQYPGAGSAELLDLIPQDRVTLRTNSSCAHANAISQGMGAGLLPTYARTLSKNIVPVLGDLHFRREIYLTYRRDIGERKHTRAAINWLKSAFNPKQHTCFAERFVSPENVEDRL